MIDREAQRLGSVTGIKSQTQQDRAVNEPPPVGPIFDRTKEHLGTSDAVIIQMRRVMLRAVRELGEGIGTLRRAPRVPLQCLSGGLGLEEGRVFRRGRQGLHFGPS